MWVAIAGVAALAVAVYEYWFAGDDKPAGGGGKSPALASAAGATSTATAGPGATGATKVPALNAAIVAAVPQARAWVQGIAHTGFNLSWSGDSLVKAIFQISDQLGKNAVPATYLLLARFGKETGQDWSNGLGSGQSYLPRA